MVNIRKYMLTLKAVEKGLKGNKSELLDTFDSLLKRIQGQNNYMSVEDKNTNNVHLHALISCPLIRSKKDVAPLGYHLHMEIVKYKEYEDIEARWLKYINKEKSDADRYTLLYGLSFPLEEDLPLHLF